MKTVGAYEAKTHLSELLDEVANHGSVIVIARHGKPIAELRPITGQAGKLTPEEALARLRARRGLRLAGTSIRELIEEGRR